MHELWLCKSIFNIVREKLENTSYKQVKKIILEIGILLAIEESVLQGCFAIMVKDTFAQGAILQINSIFGEAMCETCRKKVAIKQYAEACQYCNQFNLTILRGEELRVQAVEVE